MKSWLISVILLCISSLSYSQTKYIKSLILLTESEVIQYLDSLNGLKKDRYYYVRKDTSDDGNLFLSVSFNPSDEKFYTCTSIQLGFTESDGVNYCTFQLIMGIVKYSGNNLSYVKRNFIYISEGHWAKPYKTNIPIVIDVTFERETKDEGVYSLIYQAQRLK